ncbi:cytosolic 5'-nucleotidase 1A-like [Saccoglossus kowalevskii]|uniref:Cytosolic 5'-nucleotidase 1A-like n=1 Tax=Saccoglossus kowalevskii TaxID=10224 RepID=A0ABM0MVE0_SACKO|nr:PREDICTED: cytosolic 5'-nucleotidase 1A-like [Saccoglossus kowalevskii]
MAENHHNHLEVPSVLVDDYDNNKRSVNVSSTELGTPKKRKFRDANIYKALVVAVSSRALFNVEDEHKISYEKGLQEFIRYQVEHENVPCKPGTAFAFIKALQYVNEKLLELDPQEEEIFDVVLMTQNHGDTSIRLINSINHYELKIERATLSGGSNPIEYLKAWNTSLFLSANKELVKEALENGIAAAAVQHQDVNPPTQQLRVAFDGDAVLFSDESERIVKEEGLVNFFEHETKLANEPIGEGPLKNFAEKLGRIQKKFPKTSASCCEMPIRTYLVTARSMASAGKRALVTLRSWGLEIDETFFLSGAKKAPFLETIKPHLFFDDQEMHILAASESGTPSAHVPHGVAQEYGKKDKVKKTLSSEF